MYLTGRSITISLCAPILAVQARIVVVRRWRYMLVLLRSVGVKDFIDGFKKFAIQGNVIEAAVGLVLALAFAPVIKALVDGVLMPIVGAIFGQQSFDTLVIDMGSGRGVISYGFVITALVTFLLTAFALYVVVVKPYQALKARHASGEEKAPAPDQHTVLLTEIRDALRK